MLQNILRSLEIETDEARIYLELLETGSSPVGRLSKKTGIARATLYDTLKRLTDKGVVYRSQAKGVTTFRAEEPEHLNRLFEKKMEELSQQQKNLNELIPKLRSKIDAQFLPPRFEFFEGLESVKYAMQDFLFHHNIESYNYWNVEMVQLLGMEHFFYANRKRLENNISQKLIASGAPSFSVKQYPFTGCGAFFKRELRVAPETMTTPMSYWVYDNKVLFLSSRIEAYAYIIESREMANTMREQFLAVWQISKPYQMKKGEGDEFVHYMKQNTFSL